MALLSYSLLSIILSFCAPNRAWNLSTLGTNTSEVLHVTLCGARAFLSISRDDPHQSFTLLETLWPERPKLPLNVKPFPPREPQTVGNCISVQSAVSGAFDGLWHLYVLDVGWKHVCPPKIIVFDIITNKKVLASVLHNVPQTRLNSIVVDMASRYGPRAYVGEPRPGLLIVFDFRTGVWWELPLSADTRPFSWVPSTFQLALSGTTLFLTSDTTDSLFKMDLTTLRSTGPPSLNSSKNMVNKRERYESTFLGHLLGPPRGLAVDSRRGLNYCLGRDYVCVRWDSNLPLVAESHQVLLQSADLLPYVYQLFMDLFDQLWALTSNNNGAHCVQIKRTNAIY